MPTTAGTLKRVRVYGRTHDDVRRKLTKLLEQADQGIPVAARKLDRRAVPRRTGWSMSSGAERRPKTYQGYEGVVRLYLIPGLGKKRLDKLTAQDVRVFITRVRDAVPVLQARRGRRSRRAAMLRSAQAANAARPGCRFAWSSPSTPC